MNYNLSKSINESISTCLTDDADFDLSADGGHVVLQLQGIAPAVRPHARRHHQFGEGGLGGDGDTLVGRRRQLLVAEGPLGGGGRVAADGDPDGERLRHNHLEPVFEGAKVKGRSN